MRLLIIAGSARTNPDVGRLPAIQRYDGPAFRTLRAFQRTHPDAPLTVMILSAHYGLIPADLLIPWSDQPIYRAQAVALRPQVRHALPDAPTGNARWSETCLMLGKTYRQALPISAFWFARLGILTLPHGHIGQQLSVLKHWLHAPDCGV